MSSAIPGAPIGPDIEPSRRQRSFDHVPKLRELLANGGWPGVVYAQVCVQNLKAASDRLERPANLRPIRGASYYSIVGPTGEAPMALLGCGKPIPGSAPEGGSRLFFTDGEVGLVTGHTIEYPIWLTAAPASGRGEEIHVREEHVAPVKRAYKKRKGHQGHARVRGRYAPQREPAGPEGDEPQASSGDRALGAEEGQ